VLLLHGAASDLILQRAVFYALDFNDTADKVRLRHFSIRARHLKSSDAPYSLGLGYPDFNNH